MIPSRNTLAHASAALDLMLPFVEPADGVLSRYFRANPELGAQDRAFIAESTFGVLRRKRLLDALAPQPIGRHLLLSYLVRVVGLSIRQLSPLLLPGDADWLGEIKARALNTFSLAVQLDLPDWLFERLQAQMSEADLIALGRALQTAAPLDLRVNTLRATREEVVAKLGAEKIHALPTPYSPIGVRLDTKPALNKNKLFVSGKIEVQDEGSQLLGFLVAPTRHDTVVDFCAGAGGKTLMLGALMHSQGRLYAFDVSEKRLANLKPRLKRSGLSNIHPYVIQHENDTKVKRLAGKIDRVLVDAPCSGLGTLRRNPDLKWRQTPESVAELVLKQTAILAAAAKLVKPGGRLVYATCSLLREENEGVVEHFLAQHEAFTLEPCGPLLARHDIAIASDAMLHLSTALHGTDGFFAAVLTRAASHD
jgi:16S rRNA (cytosine967-C5)-methyltransferase